MHARPPGRTEWPGGVTAVRGGNHKCVWLGTQGPWHQWWYCSSTRRGTAPDRRFSACSTSLTHFQVSVCHQATAYQKRKNEKKKHIPSSGKTSQGKNRTSEIPRAGNMLCSGEVARLGRNKNGHLILTQASIRQLDSSHSFNKAVNETPPSSVFLTKANVQYTLYCHTLYILVISSLTSSDK